MCFSVLDTALYVVDMFSIDYSSINLTVKVTDEKKNPSRLDQYTIQQIKRSKIAQNYN